MSCNDVAYKALHACGARISNSVIRIAYRGPFAIERNDRIQVIERIYGIFANKQYLSIFLMQFPDLFWSGGRGCS